MDLILGAIRIAVISLTIYVLFCWAIYKYESWDESWAWDETKRKSKKNYDWWRD